MKRFDDGPIDTCGVWLSVIDGKLRIETGYENWELDQGEAAAMEEAFRIFSRTGHLRVWDEPEVAKLREERDAAVKRAEVAEDRIASLEDCIADLCNASGAQVTVRFVRLLH